MALRHGIAYGLVATRYGAASRPVSVTSLDAAGHVLATRPLGWSAEHWQTHGPKTPAQMAALEKAQLKTMLKHAPAPRPPCTGAHPVAGSSSFVAVWDDFQSRVLATVLPAGLGLYGGELYVVSTQKASVAIVDAHGTRTSVDLGRGNCAYVKLTAPERARPFRVEWRTARGATGVVHPNDWAGFPTD
jgi:hypothetical protein